MESVVEKKSFGSSTMLGPGFRFHPTDEELVRYYLKRKICGKAFRLDAISEVDVYKSEPWDLPRMSKLKTRDQEWYFYSVLDKKYGNKARTNRATEKGYWKTTGKDRPIYHYKQIVGMKKTLVYHRGRAPHGQRSNWVMHEYRLAELELEKVGIVQDAFVLCRIFQKSGSGPKNGEQYGAPFVEEEWEDDELVLVPQEETSVVVDIGDDDFLDGHDLQQILHSNIPSDANPFPLNFQSANGNSIGETATFLDDTQNPLLCAGQQKFDEDAHKNFHDLPAPYNTEVKPSSHEYIGECSKSSNFEDLDFFLDETFLDAIDELHGEEGFIEANDLSNPIHADTSALDMLDEYLTFVDAYENSPYITYVPASIPGSKDVISNGVLLPQKDFILGTEEASLPSGELINNMSNNADLPFDRQELAKGQSDTFVKKASQILGKISAPPAFAAEFPSKDAVIHLNSVARSSSSMHVNSGINQTRNSDLGGHGKNENFHLVLSFGLAHGDDGSASLESNVSLLPGKIESTMFRGWFCFMFLWVLILSVGIKVGTFICAN